MDKHACDNCGREFTEDQLREVEHLSERVAPGGTMPSGECPECGALCFPAKPATPTPGATSTQTVYRVTWLHTPRTAVSPVPVRLYQEFSSLTPAAKKYAECIKRRLEPRIAEAGETADTPDPLKFVRLIAGMKTEEEFCDDAPPSEDWISTLNDLIAQARKLCAATKG